MKHNDGGPVFPDPGRAQSVKQRELLGNQGMTLRDYFAAKALIGWRESETTTYDGDARAAYEMADAMIKARSQP